MYWAAYLGKEDIVERIIRLGYSPFVRSYEKKSAFMAAIDGKRIKIIQVILSFTYIPLHTSKFEYSR
jgi:ankyrin repeat protein